MLKLSNATKDYKTGETVVNALRDVNLQFRKNEFVSIVGPSGCGKTTLLNIVGGLDKYTTGDLIIEGTSTKDYSDREWDTYRNKRIGFVFQSYNLIMHLNVLSNVELALTLSGVDSAERKQKAMDALKKVGLEEQVYKKPNQLSGGQMQRVAIARALVNNPDIILADEPTGALDSVTSVQIMELLKEVAGDKLVIMVTHNGDIAKKYSSRIISFVDGVVVSDTNPFEEVEEPKIASEKVKVGKRKKEKKNLTSMSFLTALKLSFTNLRSKKGRTIITSIAGSIGIIGVALVLAISNGFSLYIKKMQTDALSTYPLQINEKYINMSMPEMEDKGDKFPSIDEVLPEKSVINTSGIFKANMITNEYIKHTEGIKSSLYSAINYRYDLDFNMARKGADEKIFILNPSSTAMSSIIGDNDFIKTQYDLLHGSYPTGEKDMIVVVNKYNELGSGVLEQLGFDKTANVKFGDIVGKKYKIIHNDNFYYKNGDVYASRKAEDSQTALAEMYGQANNTELTISGILRIKPDTNLSTMGSGIYYRQDLVGTIYSDYSESNIAKAQKDAGKSVNVLTGVKFVWDDLSKYQTPDLMMIKMQEIAMKIMSGQRVAMTEQEAYEQALNKMGAHKQVVGIDIYATDFNTKEEIKEYLSEYNSSKEANDITRVTVVDNAEMLTNMMTQMVDVITIALVCFAGVSLVVSSVMIGVITYVSVVERTKEIGILRSIGARKKDISRVFNAETFIIGLLAGLIGVVFTYILSIPINLIVASLVDIAGIASLNILAALILIVVSVGLTMLAGLIPSRLAAKKDPVVALRTE